MLQQTKIFDTGPIQCLIQIDCSGVREYAGYQFC